MFSRILKKITVYKINNRKQFVVGAVLALLFCLLVGGFNNYIIQCCGKSDNRFHLNRKFEEETRPSFPQCLPRQNSSLSCIKLVMGDKEEIKKVQVYIKHNKISSKCHLSNLLRKCMTLKLAHGYVTKNEMVLPEERNFPLAFAIKMHTNPVQAEQLLRTIYRPHNTYCIYVDKKSDIKTFEIMKSIGRCFHNIHVIENRINVIYSSINIVEAELECMRTLIKSNSSWKYYINLTGQEFPLKTNFEIVKILQKLNGANDIESYDFPFVKQKRYTRRYEIRGNNIYETKAIKHSFIKRFHLRKGSAYGAFSRPFVEFILTDNVAIEFIKWLNGTYAPEESAWATLNSLPWAPGGYKNATPFMSRAVIWSHENGISCQSHFVRGVCVYTAKDLPWLIHRDELFANKFYKDRDPIVLDCLEEFLKNRTKTNKLEDLNWFRFNTLPHAKYHTEFHSKLTRSYLNRQKINWLHDHQVTSNLEPLKGKLNKH